MIAFLIFFLFIKRIARMSSNGKQIGDEFSNNIKPQG